MRARLPGQNKKQREGLALLTATMLDVRSANLMDLAASLPRAAERLHMRYQCISRLSGNARIEVDAVMAPHGREVLARLAEGGRRRLNSRWLLRSTVRRPGARFSRRLARPPARAFVANRDSSPGSASRRR